jgi:hypothetical protein
MSILDNTKSFLLDANLPTIPRAFMASATSNRKDRRAGFVGYATFVLMATEAAGLPLDGDTDMSDHINDLTGEDIWDICNATMGKYLQGRPELAEKRNRHIQARVDGFHHAWEQVPATAKAVIDAVNTNWLATSPNATPTAGANFIATIRRNGVSATAPLPDGVF